MSNYGLIAHITPDQWVLIIPSAVLAGYCFLMAKVA